MPSLVREIVNSVVHLLLPQLCEGCRTPLIYNERVLCMACMLELSQTGFHNIDNNDAAMRFAGRVSFKHASAFAYFTTDGLLQHLLHRLKYNGRQSIGTFLGKQAAYSLQATEWIRNIDAIVPVPLHPKKEDKRGYNQSTIIASGLSEVLQIPVLPKALTRKRDTESQTRKSREERVENVQDAFSVSPKGVMHKKHVLLIDDVLTTGATLEAAANALLDVKDLQVSILAIGLATI